MLFGGVVPLRDHGRLAAGDPRHRERLGGVAEEERAGLPLELEAVDHVRLHVAVRVDLDVVPRAGRERVPVRPRSRVLAGNHVREQRDGVRLVRAPERVDVRQVGRRILRDERRLPVARRRARARADRERSGDGRCYQREGRARDRCCFPHCTLLEWGLESALVRTTARAAVRSGREDRTDRRREANQRR